MHETIVCMDNECGCVASSTLMTALQVLRLYDVLLVYLMVRTDSRLGDLLSRNVLYVGEGLILYSVYPAQL